MIVFPITMRCPTVRMSSLHFHYSGLPTCGDFAFLTSGSVSTSFSSTISSRVVSSGIVLSSFVSSGAILSFTVSSGVVLYFAVSSGVISCVFLSSIACKENVKLMKHGTAIQSTCTYLVIGNTEKIMSYCLLKSTNGRHICMRKSCCVYYLVGCCNLNLCFMTDQLNLN